MPDLDGRASRAITRWPPAVHPNPLITQPGHEEGAAVSTAVAALRRPGALRPARAAARPAGEPRGHRRVTVRLRRAARDDRRAVGDPAPSRAGHEAGVGNRPAVATRPWRTGAERPGGGPRGRRSAAPDGPLGRIASLPAPAALVTGSVWPHVGRGGAAPPGRSGRGDLPASTPEREADREDAGARRPGLDSPLDRIDPPALPPAAGATGSARPPWPRGAAGPARRRPTCRRRCPSGRRAARTRAPGHPASTARPTASTPLPAVRPPVVPLGGPA